MQLLKREVTMDTNKSRQNIRQFDGERYILEIPIKGDTRWRYILHEKAPIEPDRNWENMDVLLKSI